MYRIFIRGATKHKPRSNHKTAYVVAKEEMSSDQKKTDELPGTSVHKTDEVCSVKYFPGLTIKNHILPERTLFT